MNINFLLPLAALLTLSACATYTTPAPAVPNATVNINRLRLVNDSPDTQPRTYFSDGITSYKTNYRGWTQEVINRLSTHLRSSGYRGEVDRLLSFSLQSMNCSGHYIADCSVSLLVSRGDGVRIIYNTDTFNGWPIATALDRALDASVSLIVADNQIKQFIAE